MLTLCLVDIVLVNNFQIFSISNLFNCQKKTVEQSRNRHLFVSKRINIQSINKKMCSASMLNVLSRYVMNEE